jgi:eukaryotic-like serine/threonine-protein kinase
VSAAPRIASAPAAGDEIWGYRILEELGRGAAAVVYRARDLRLDRDVALKALHAGAGLSRGDAGPVDASGDPALRRMLREARLLSRLLHPAIVPLLGAFAHGGVPWLVMEFVAGDALVDILARSGPLPVADVLRMGESLASGLEFAHSRGVLHQDVTPNNILVTADGRAKLADFGLARLSAAPRRRDGGAGPDGPASAAAPGPRPSEITGTRGYLAPEQALGLPLDPRSDVYSLGVVLYEMCTGRAAFPDVERQQPPDSIPAHDPVPPRQWNPSLTEPFERVLLQAMAVDRDGRFQSAGELEGALHALR